MGARISVFTVFILIGGRPIPVFGRSGRFFLHESPVRTTQTFFFLFFFFFFCFLFYSAVFLCYVGTQKTHCHRVRQERVFCMLWSVMLFCPSHCWLHALGIKTHAALGGAKEHKRAKAMYILAGIPYYYYYFFYYFSSMAVSGILF
ncbi:hypothetical protein B0T22DRAFT_29226 [Podospora appendiculata]|uniref:Uncharacterized protein n=1 Tax=Podospora appendiculata TaxID=314037 RepID=A0AAE0XGF7_9PEZI|nr:hypothetical protein B0T22DRAFT_29226 [Podospora appendiculata]